MKQTLKHTPFTLVLSGGGALGIAHLGVLHDMEAQHLHPAEIVGTSMGGIIGACLAIGMKEAEIYTRIQSFVKVSNWIKFSLSGNAIVDNDKIAEIFGTLFGERKMHETEIPLKLITTHLKTGDKRVFTPDDDIPVKDAVLATMAIPGVFEEHTIEGEVYGDGFLCENLGVPEASHRLVLAVDVLGEHSFEKELPDNFFKTQNVLEMFERSMRLLIYNQSRTALRHTDREILLIEPDTKDFSTYQFHKYAQIRRQGLGLL
jgi:NTE family protein